VNRSLQVNADFDAKAHRLFRLVLAAALLAASGFAGIVHGSLLSEREAEMFFDLTNPDGPAGDYRSWRLAQRVCSPAGAAAGSSCVPGALTSVAPPQAPADPRTASLEEE
jgi:hypothetical protein